MRARRVVLGACLLTVALTAPAPSRAPTPPVVLPVAPRPVIPVRFDIDLDVELARAEWFHAASVAPPVTVTLPRATRRSSGFSSTAECIAARENGGDYGRSSNPSHFGKYQYDRQTWAAHGGNPDTWGSASPEEQEAVFARGTAQYGYGAWTPYDGC